MKKTLSLVMLFVLAFTMAMSVSAAKPVDGRKTCTAYIGEVALDGKIDDAWEYAPVIKVDTVKQNASKWYGDKTKVAGKDYATLDCKVLWDGKSTLYMLFVVKDKTISLVGKNPWDKDSCEFFIQLENSTDAKASKTQVRLLADGKNELGNVKFGYAKTADGLVYEVAYDISKVGGAGQYFGIDFQYNDDAEGKGVRNVCLGWSGSTDKASSDASVYGQCLLSDKTVASVKAAAEAAKKESAKTADPAAMLAVVMALSGAAAVVSKKR